MLVSPPGILCTEQINKQKNLFKKFVLLCKEPLKRTETHPLTYVLKQFLWNRFKNNLVCSFLTSVVCWRYVATPPWWCMLERVISWLLRPDGFHKSIMLKINKCYYSEICLEWAIGFVVLGLSNPHQVILRQVKSLFEKLIGHSSWWFLTGGENSSFSAVEGEWLWHVGHVRTFG